MARPSCGPGNGSRALCVNGKPCRAATLVVTSGPALHGLRSRCLVSEEVFALAEEQLEKNQRHSPRRTTEPTLLQGMLVCEQCGYALYRAATHTSKQKLNYYRCIGSDGYRRLNGPVCTNRPIRQDYLDQFVWNEIIRLLDDPELIQTEIDRRREAHEVPTRCANARRSCAANRREWRRAANAW
jgi:site-specific DNA recombinase